jgi:hypothetical protein
MERKDMVTLRHLDEAHHNALTARTLGFPLT